MEKIQRKSRQRKLTKADWLKVVQRTAKTKRGKCLSKTYQTAHVKLKFECRKKHKWWARPVNVIRGSWCPTCAVEIQHIGQRKKISEIASVVKERGGILKSREAAYINKNSKLSIVCSARHDFKITWGSLCAGSWCFRCGRIEAGLKQRIDIEKIRKLAKARGGKLISQSYSRALELLEWECFGGHRWKANYNNVARGQWCPTCSRAVSISEQIVRKYLETLSGLKFPQVWPEWLVSNDGRRFELDGYNEKNNLAFEHHGTQHYRETKFYRGAAFKNRVETDRYKRLLCKQRGVKLLEIRELLIQTNLDDLRIEIIKFLEKNGIKPVSGYEEMSININSLYSIDPLDRIRPLIKSRGGTLVSKNWQGYREKYVVVCSKKHTFEISPGKLVSGQWCRFCMWDAIREKNTKHTIEEMKEVARRRKGRCLSEKYVSYKDLLEWECREGHRWKANPSNILQGKWCRLCAIRLRKKH